MRSHLPDSIRNRLIAVPKVRLKVVDDPAWVPGLWPLSRFESWSREYGPVRHTLSPVAKDKPMYFTFWCEPDEEFPSFVKSALARRYFAFASCVQCGTKMTSFQTHTIQQSDNRRLYFICECGHPVWQMEYEQFDVALNVMEDNARRYRRKTMLAEAGGRHRKQDIANILAKQKGRCIYCNRLFGPDLVPTRDHLLALTYGGGDWPLNIVLACRSCNSSRCDLPFRTFVRMLSAAQNKRILVHLVERLRDLNNDEVTRQGLACFNHALTLHEPTGFRYNMMKKASAAKRNLLVNKLLPKGVLGLQKAYIAVLRAKNRRLRENASRT
jgi:5-methylcytosine-specific restriction endonuclease McrA